MPRKLKPDHLKQKILIPVRVTDSENRLLARAARRSRLPTATFVRLAAINVGQHFDAIQLARPA
jgi:uncharacterized protein (DUF1778 family)